MCDWRAYRAILHRNHGQPGGDRAAVNPGQRQAEQWLGVDQQVALDLDAAARLEAFTLVGQIRLHDGAHRFDRAGPSLGLLTLRIPAQPYHGVQFGGGLAGLRYGERLGIAQRNAAMLRADLELVHPGPRAGAPEP